MNIEDLEVRMKFYGNRSKPRNVKEAKIFCANCGKESWQTYQRVRKYLAEGTNSFCSRKCASLYWTSQLEPTRLGKENAGFTWDKKAGVWNAYWDDETGRMHSTTKARWLWEMYRGEVPDGYWVTFIDGDKSNCELDNLTLISRGERMSAAMMGHQHSEEAKQNMSKAHTGKVLSEEHRANISKAMSGDKNPSWIDGSNAREYPWAFSRIREYIIERDNNECRACFKKFNVWSGDIHHKDRNKENNGEENLILLCHKCHMEAHNFKRTNNSVIQELQEILRQNL